MTAHMIELKKSKLVNNKSPWSWLVAKLNSVNIFTVYTSADKLGLLPFCWFMQKICQHIVIIDWFIIRLFSDEWCGHNWWLSSNTNTIQAIPKSMVTEGVHKVQLFTRSLRKIVKLGVKIYKFIKVLRVAELCWNMEWC